MDVRGLNVVAGLAERARQALQRREPAEALRLLRDAEAGGPSVEILLDKALALRMLGEHAQAIEAIDAALVLDPRNFLALLSKGALLERVGRVKQAAIVYKNALAVTPSGDPPPSLAAPVARAKQAVADHADTLAAHLRASVADLRAGLPGEALGRFDESLEIFAGRAKPFAQQPLLFHFPRLPAIPFHDRSWFPWLGELEAATGTIREELENLLASRLDGFAPYIAFPPGVPVNQWGELNHSPKWNSFFLWRDGARQDAACDLCPHTADLLASLPMANQPGFAPTAMFSVLAARTRIPPHTGSANTRLIVHLPLILPGRARFRVGAETREWRLGEAWVFDDTIEHEAWNDADAPRSILILDVWNPLLSLAERALVSAMMTAKNSFLDAG